MEVLLSGVIIIIILSALVTIGRAAMSNNEYLDERAQAIYLAQEGIEYTRQIRDTNWIDGTGTTAWDTLTGSGAVETKCYSLPDTFVGRAYLVSGTTAGDADACALEVKQDIVIGATGSTITFNRKIFVDHNLESTNLLPALSGSADALRDLAINVTSMVSWTFQGQTNSIRLSEILTNWRPNY